MDWSSYPANVAITDLKSRADHSVFAGTVGREAFHCLMPMVKKKKLNCEKNIFPQKHIV